MEKIKIEKYDETKFEHRYVFAILDNDDTFNRYIGEAYHLVENMKEKQKLGFYDQIYIAFVKELPVGFLELRTLDGHPYVNIGIIPENRGHHYGRKLLGDFIEYLFYIHREYENIYASISPQNIASIKNFLSLGFERINCTKYVKKRD